uniref:NADH-ubiquinone oxidoreductase chain 3 n=1 Tax=Chiropterargas boueti TaxID=1827022 RepID=A0A1P8AG96_9ACAR|nr:NADH dehydrogenase subunit 3 [Chiropterargas boueti]AMX74085.1 NADH dehydrogenase subunit 3 [Chiropterargas boueti]
MNYIIIAMMITLSMLILATSTSKFKNFHKEKNSPFECGFDPFSLTRIPFSLRFFMISILFLMFDIEVVIMLPMPLSSNSTSYMMLTMSTILFLILTGLLYEWKLGMVQWFT